MVRRRGIGPLVGSLDGKGVAAVKVRALLLVEGAWCCTRIAVVRMVWLRDGWTLLICQKKISSSELFPSIPPTCTKSYARDAVLPSERFSLFKDASKDVSLWEVGGDPRRDYD